MALLCKFVEIDTSPEERYYDTFFETPGTLREGTMKVLILLGVILLASCHAPLPAENSQFVESALTSTAEEASANELYYEGSVTLPNRSVASFMSYHRVLPDNKLREEEIAFELESNQPNDPYILRAVFREGAMIGSSACLHNDSTVQCTRITDSPDQEIREKGERALWVAYQSITLFLHELFRKEYQLEPQPRPQNPQITYTT